MTEREIKTIRRYYTRPVTALAWFGSGLLAMVFGILLEMIGSVAFDLKGSTGPALYGALVLLLLCMALFLVQAISVMWGVRRKKWAAIAEKARTSVSYTDRTTQLLAANTAVAAGRLMSRSDNDTIKTAGDISTAVGGVVGMHAIVGILFEVRKSAKHIAELLGIKLPAAKPRVLAILLLPAALLVAITIPSYLDGIQQHHESAAQAAAVVEKLEQVFEASCDSVSADDPAERYKDYGYGVTGRLKDENNDTRSYLAVTVNNNGVVEAVTYSLGIDVNSSKEDNIAQAKADMERLNQALRSADVPFLSPNLGETHTLREDFIALFWENSYYENCRSYYEEEGLSMGYYTESQEDYNDYSSSYFYITVKPPEEEN